MSLKLSDKKLAVLGAGKLGGILLRAYLKEGLFLAQARYRDCEARGKGSGACKRARGRRNKRQSQGRDRCRHRSAERKTPSRDGAVEGDRS